MKYDSETDSLHIPLVDPMVPAYSSEGPGFTVIRRSIETNEIVGVEVDHFFGRAFHRRRHAVSIERAIAIAIVIVALVWAAAQLT